MRAFELSRRRFAQASLAALAASACAPRQEGDLILHGGPIYTGLGDQKVEALRLSGGRVAFAGALADAQSAGARMIDLGGAAAFPGFVDGHVHLGGVGMAAMVLDLVGVESIAALQARLREYAAAHPQGPIYGRGWIETHWPERRFPSAADLDAIVPGRPVLLERVDGHAAVANTNALNLAGITNSTPNPDGGAIERGADGAATGMLIDRAAELVQARFPAPTPQMRRDAMAAAVQLYAARGWTGAANMSTSLEEAQILQDLAAKGELPLAADLYLTPEDSPAVYERGPYADDTGLVHVRGVKLYMDGALGSRGAALLAPYSDAPSSGLLVTPVETVRDFLTRARARGVQVATHAIGDRGNRLVLDAYRDVFADDAPALRAARWRIEHAQVIAPEDIPRFAAMGVIASMQPSHAISDLHFAPARLGAARLAGAYAWRSLAESGAVLAAGSDAPVEKGDPLIEFYAAAVRRDLAGFAGPDWRAEEALSRAEALKMLTWGPAYASFQEGDRGVLEAGKRADVSVFSADLIAAPPEAIPAAAAVLTISGGRVTHDAR
ncbi:MAG TPA: amidohydrolase [Terricaulis sp.]|nr:amidohydrolase [Terricaulis sp.]